MRSKMSPTTRNRLLYRLCDRARGEQGSAIAEFAFVAIMLVFLLFAVLQVAVFFYVRNVVAASAGDGARFAANADSDGGSGAQRANQKIADSLSDAVSAGVPCEETRDIDAVSGVELVAVRCHGRIRSIFLPVGAFVEIDVTSRALAERR
jgi:Flp pilus assembly protein TadG